MCLQEHGKAVVSDSQRDWIKGKDHVYMPLAKLAIMSRPPLTFLGGLALM